MEKQKYHHGDLKKELINNGLLLLNEEGFEGFSLRKVASMCGVSHNAPYKHFKDKEELICAIANEVSKNFYAALLKVNDEYKDNIKLQIIEMGKSYVKFMVENPESLKFMFLSDNNYAVKVGKDKIYDCKNNAFKIFKNCAEKFLKETSLKEDLYLENILSMWSIVHGLSLLIVKKNVEYEGNYLELVEKIMKTYVENLK